MSRPWNNGTDTSVGYMHPQKAVGTVIFNARINGAVASMGKTNPNPLFERALGSSADNMDYVEAGDLLYTYAGDGAKIHAMSRSSHRNDYSAIQCLSVLNGQGRRGESIDALTSNLEFVGVCEMGTKETGNSLFNAIKRGIRTMINNGHETIEQGSWIEWYVPTEEQAAKGGRGLIADANGERKLQIRPFRVTHHKHTPKAIYACLMQLSAAGWDRTALTANAEDSFSSEFVTQSLEFLESVIQMAVIASTLDKPGEATATYNQLMARRDDLVDALFAQYGEDWDPKDAANPTLKRFKAEAAGRYLYAAGAHCAAVEARKIGKAMTTAMPKHNISVHLK